MSLMNLHQFFIRLQGCHYGNQVVSKNPRFCLWEPVLKLALDLKAEVVELPTPHVRVKELRKTPSWTALPPSWLGFAIKTRPSGPIKFQDM